MWEIHHLGQTQLSFGLSSFSLIVSECMVYIYTCVGATGLVWKTFKRSRFFSLLQYVCTYEGVYPLFSLPRVSLSRLSLSKTVCGCMFSVYIHGCVWGCEKQKNNVGCSHIKEKQRRYKRNRANKWGGKTVCRVTFGPPKPPKSKGREEEVS